MEILPFHSAIREGNVEVVREFLSRGVVDVNKKLIKLDLTPVQVAVYYDQKRVLRLLLDAGARESVNEKDDEGNTALHSAVLKLNRKIVRTLIDAGADVNVRNNQGATPLQWVLSSTAPDVFMIRTLMDAGADVNARSPQNGRAALHLAAINNDESLMEYLFTRGADVNVEDENNRRTPLHWAAIYSTGKSHLGTIVKLLLEKAVVDAKDDKGRTPVDYLRKDAGRNAEIILLLLNYVERNKKPSANSEYDAVVNVDSAIGCLLIVLFFIGFYFLLTEKINT